MGYYPQPLSCYMCVPTSRLGTPMANKMTVTPG
jgi:hypothetical protein